MSEYDIGDKVTLYMWFYDGNGSPADPTTISVSVKNPAGTTSTPTATKISTGYYEAYVTPDKSGRWWYKYTSDSTFGVVEETYFDVKRSAFS